MVGGGYAGHDTNQDGVGNVGLMTTGSERMYRVQIEGGIEKFVDPSIFKLGNKRVSDLKEDYGYIKKDGTTNDAKDNASLKSGAKIIGTVKPTERPASQNPSN